MPSISITGAQWGDEGKAKVADAINEKADLVVKYQGGSNAGNTVVDDQGNKRVLHLLSTGAVRGIRSLIASGVVMHPERLDEELESFDYQVDLGIDPRTQIVFPYHLAMDVAQEKHRNKGKGAIGTTCQGIGPCYADAASRTGIMFHELVSGSNSINHKIRENFRMKKRIIEDYLGFQMVVPEGGQFGAKLVEVKEDDMVEHYFALGNKHRHYLADVSREVIRGLKNKKNVLFQGAQGVMLDKAFGNYPKVTSSHPSPTGICASVGVPPQLLINMESFGVLKAYTTKVGSGPVVTCLDNGFWPVDESQSTLEGNLIRKKGAEYGATTGRLRRVGWLDLPQLQYACELGGFTQLALIKLDVLAGLETIKVANGYLVDGKFTLDYQGWDADWLNRAEPYYFELSGFSAEALEKATTYEEMPRAAKDLVTCIERYTSVPVTLISKGPRRSQTIYQNIKGF